MTYKFNWLFITYLASFLSSSGQAMENEEKYESLVQKSIQRIESGSQIIYSGIVCSSGQIVIKTANRNSRLCSTKILGYTYEGEVLTLGRKSRMLSNNSYTFSTQLDTSKASHKNKLVALCHNSKTNPKFEQNPNFSLLQKIRQSIFPSAIGENDLPIEINTIKYGIHIFRSDNRLNMIGQDLFIHDLANRSLQIYSITEKKTKQIVRNFPYTATASENSILCINPEDKDPIYISYKNEIVEKEIKGNKKKFCVKSLHSYKIKPSNEEATTSSIEELDVYNVAEHPYKSFWGNKIYQAFSFTLAGEFVYVGQGKNLHVIKTNTKGNFSGHARHELSHTIQDLSGDRFSGIFALLHSNGINFYKLSDVNAKNYLSGFQKAN